ncbi:MAG: hypothetical protein V2I47_01965, partial [Bacteroidales bacterium]|nr:hypothetical protein [Bacteroidales bacterium]
MRKAIRIIKAGEIRRQYSMQKAINAMEYAFASLSSGESFVPQRFVTAIPSTEMLMLFKPAFVEKDKRISIKFLTQREGFSIPGIPTIQGIILLIDSLTGEILALMDGEYVTALRTGAASGLATRYFARKDAQYMALFGCGAQGRTQVEAVCCERKIKKLYLFDPSREAAEQFIREMQEEFELEMIHTQDTSVLKELDIICTATNARAPLFRIEDVSPGIHINAIGSFQPHMQELDPFLIKAARVYVDQIEPCVKESGDLVKAMEAGIITEDHIHGEIGEYCLEKITGRESDNEITIFKSVGVAIQDYAVATDI